MTCRVLPVAAVLVLASAGCLSDEKKVTTVAPNPFGAAPGKQMTRAMHAPATEAVSLRVAELGRKIVRANPQIKAQTAVTTVGDPQPQIFHSAQNGIWQVVISEGLVRQCKTDGQLAAVLSQELGKLASEQSALARPAPRRPERPPLPYVPVGNDITGPLGGADGTRQMELARYEKGRRQAEQLPPPPPPPESLARAYLVNAGFAAADLEAVAPLLRAADQNAGLEKQMTAPAVSRPDAGGPAPPFSE
jgi:hypothetical protein